jgi:hypothetical protein
MRGCDGVGHVLRSSSLLHVKSSRARIFWSGLKTGRDMTAGGARGPFIFYTFTIESDTKNLIT